MSCKFDNPNNKYFSSDWHLFHHNIIEYCNRPYKNVKEMHKAMQSIHNDIVLPDDEVWHIGDFTLLSASHLERIRKEVIKFNGIKHIVVGNHDEWKVHSYERVGFTTVHSVMWFKYRNITFYLAHDPAIYTVLEKDSSAVLLCGHIHKLFKHLLPEKRVINVGVDVWDMKPVAFNQILEILKIYGVLI